MKEKWKAIANLLEEEFDIEVQPSYEGWGAGYDPKFLPLLEMWAKGEVEEVPQGVRIPKGILYNVVDFLRKSEDYTVNSVRHEIALLLHTYFPHWRFGQREVFRAGYVPTAFLVLFAVLESLKVDSKLVEENPSSFSALKKRYKEILSEINPYYPYHELAISFVYSWINEDYEFSDEVKRYHSTMERSFYEYLKEKNPQSSYDIVMEDLWQKFRVLVDLSKDLNYVDLLIEEARGRNREDAHKARIMTDILSKLPTEIKNYIKENKNKKATQFPSEVIKQILKALDAIPDWMKDYLKQMSYIDLLEKDISFLNYFLPKTLEVDVEHRGFISFIFKAWEEVSANHSLKSKKQKEEEELSDLDKKFKKEHGLTQKEFQKYRLLLKSVLPYVEHFKRKFDNFLPKEEELWDGKYYRGKRLNYKRVATEVPIGRGRIFMKREIPERKELVFELLMDISSSMKKEEKILNALKSLILVSEVLDKLKMEFSIKVFNENVYTIKDFNEDYRIAKARILDILDSLGGSTDLSKAINVGVESLETVIKKEHKKGVLILFTDGQPTKGLKGDELKYMISQMKMKIPIVAIGVGEATHMVKEYFEKTGISVEDIAKLPSVFSFVMENQFRRLLSVS
ncbi:MAG: VWA domain-containing protein [Aquifex sp.]|nr:MAG: VWA domain-containing protein [Aquifex sp.]